MKDHYDGKQVVSIWNKKLGTIILVVSVQAAKRALCVIRHLPLLPEVELSDRKIGWDFLWKKMQIVYKVVCMSLMTEFSGLGLSFLGNESSILALPEDCKLY